MTGNFRDKIQPLVNQLHDACAEADLDCVTVIRPDPYEGPGGQPLQAISVDATLKGNGDHGVRLSRAYLHLGDKPFTLNMPLRGAAERLSVGGVNKKDNEMQNVDGPMGAMSFSQALSLATNEGTRITRPWWSSKGQLCWVGVLRPEQVGAASPHPDSYVKWSASTTAPNESDKPDLGDRSSSMLLYIAVQTERESTRDGAPISYHSTDVSFGWKPTIDDMLAMDWTIVPT